MKAPRTVASASVSARGGAAGSPGVGHGAPAAVVPTSGRRRQAASISVPPNVARKITLFPELAEAINAWNERQTKGNRDAVVSITRELVLDHGAFGGDNESSSSIGERFESFNVVAEALNKAYTAEERLELFAKALKSAREGVNRMGQKIRVLELLGGRELGAKESELRKKHEGLAFQCVKDICEASDLGEWRLPNTPYLHEIIASPEAREQKLAQSYARACLSSSRGDLNIFRDARITNLVRAGFVDRKNRPDLVEANDFLLSLFMSSLPAAHEWT